jgi:hypothetical protein
MRSCASWRSSTAVLPTRSARRAPAPGGSLPSTSPAPGSTVERWWSTTDDRVGSVIENSEPELAASRLSPDVGGYCQALDDTAAAGNGIFPSDVDVASAGYRVATLAFVNEITAMAPDELAQPWGVLGGVITALVEANSDAAELELPAGADAAEIETAGAAISAHASSECGLTVE